MPDYNVKLPIFEGPLDLLLHLIKQNEMDITEIAIAEITGQYLDTLRLLQTLDLEVAGDFLVMAATLIHIKLRVLLPDSGEDEAEEEDVDHFLSARTLMQQLIEYRRFKEAALDLAQRSERQSQIFVREVALPALSEAEAEPAVREDLSRLLDAFSRVLRFVERRDYHQVQGEVFTVEDKIVLVRRRLLLEERFAVRELFEACESKVEMIVTLVALLELCRLKELRVSQAGAFDDICVARREAPGAADPAAGDAAELARVEAGIFADRTGLVDDGLPSGEEADQGSRFLEVDPDALDDPAAPAATGNARLIDLNAPACADGDEEQDPPR
jgi:segregation and condensation protein A